MNVYSLREEKQKLLLRYLIVVPASVFLLVVFRRWHEQLTNLRLWYMWPVWILAAHISCFLSNLLTERSLRSSWHLLRYSFLCYWKRASIVHFQSACLTALFEETIFRYLLLNLLLSWLGKGVWAIMLTSVAFVAVHLVFNRGSRRPLVGVDLFLFSLAIGALNVVTASFYPALIIHCMRNYILRLLLIRRDDEVGLRQRASAACPDGRVPD